MDVVLNYQRISTNSSLIYALRGEIVDISNSIPPDLSGEIVILQDQINDLSSDLITLTNEVDSNTAQITLNTGAISIIGGEIDTLEINVEDLSSQVLDLSTNTAKLNVANTFTANNTFTNYITTPKVEITTEPVDLSDATTKNYVDNAIAGVVFDDTSFARLDISNTFISKQTFLDTINAESVVADKFFTDNNGEELVYGNYSNTFYVNDNEAGTSGSINDTLALISQEKIIRISSGSYSEDVLVSGKTLVGLSCPNVGGTTMTELGNNNTFTIDNSLRVRVSGLQIDGMTTISGSQFKHRLEVCNFNGGLTITGGGATPLAEFMTIQDCEVAGSLTISAFTGIVYFYRVNFQNATFNISTAYSSQQVVMIDCAGIPDDISLFLGNYFVAGATTYYKNGSLKLADFNGSFYVRNTTPSQDNELASKLYVDSGVNANASSISNNTAIIAVNSTAISQLQGLLTATEANVTTNTSAISTNTSDIATKQDIIDNNSIIDLNELTAFAITTDELGTGLLNMTPTGSINFLSSGTASGNLNFFNPTNQLEVQQLNYGVVEGIETQLSTLSSSVTNLQTGKQDTLIAGTNITITGTTISSSGGGGSSFVGFRAAGDGTFSSTIAFGQTISTKLDVYTAQANSTFDTEGTYDNTLGRYTIPTGYTGWWEVSVKIYMLSYTEGGGQIGLRKNNTTIIGSGDYQGERGDFTSYIYVSEGDEMYLRQDQNSGQYSFFASRSWFQMRFIAETL